MSSRHASTASCYCKGTDARKSMNMKYSMKISPLVRCLHHFGVHIVSACSNVHKPACWKSMNQRHLILDPTSLLKMIQITKAGSFQLGFPLLQTVLGGSELCTAWEVWGVFLSHAWFGL